VKKIITLVFFLCLASALAGTLEVGPGQSYATVQAAINAASAGDVINIHNGTYTENLSKIPNSVTIQNNTGDSPILVGRILVGSSSNVTIDGLEIKGWTEPAHGIDQSNGTGLTVKNCTIHGGSAWSSSAAVNSRNSTRLTITNNEIYDVSKGIRLHSSHSTDGTYANGVNISGNHIHDCPVDGIDIHGEYFTIDGNLIVDNMDTLWAQRHPDGIQFIKSLVDGYNTASRVIIKNNIIRNHTQNVFIEGPVQDVQIFNNVIYNDGTAVVNGVDMGSLYTKNLFAGSGAVEGLFVYNNVFGPATNFSVGIRGNGEFHFKNNILIDDAPGGAFWVEFPSSIPVGEFDYNLFYVTGGRTVDWGTNRFSRLSDFQATYSNRAQNSFEADPGLGPWPEASPALDSPAIDKGVALPVEFATDRVGNSRPLGMGWDIGPYEKQISAPAAPNNLRVGP